MLLCCLHDAFQAVMGWTDSHLHQFEKDEQMWGVPEYDEFGDLDLMNESKLPVSRVLKTEGDSMVYVYDFGDDWRHEVVLEKILPSDVPTKPVCLAGERRCPPEDVGGPSGYQEFLSVIFTSGHKKCEHHRQCAGDLVLGRSSMSWRSTRFLNGWGGREAQTVGILTTHLVLAPAA